MAVALIPLLVAVGSVLFHLFSPWWWTPVCTDNLNAGVAVMKSAQDGA